MTSNETQNEFTFLFDPVVQQVGLTAAAVYGVIWRYCHMREKKCFASISTLSVKVGMSRSTFQRALKVLVGAGAIKDLSPDRQGLPHCYIAIDSISEWEPVAECGDPEEGCVKTKQVDGGPVSKRHTRRTTLPRRTTTLPPNGGSIRINADTNGIPFSDPIPIEEDTEYIPCDDDGDEAEAKPAKKKRKPQGWKRQALEDAEIFSAASRIAVPLNPNGSNGEYARQNMLWFLPLKRIRYQAGTDEAMRICLEQAIIEQRKWKADSVSCPQSVEKKAIAIAGTLKARAEEAKSERHSWHSQLTGESYDAEMDTYYQGPGQIGNNADAGT